MNQPDTEEMPASVLAEIARIEAQQREREDIIRTTSRNQRRVSLKLHNQKIKKHMRNFR